MPAGVASCANHLEREALGVCVGCRKLVCAECTTKLDGINYCVGCIAAMAPARRAGPDARPGGTARWLTAAVWYAAAAGATALLLKAVLGS